MKMIMLIQHAEKKENSFSKRYEMSKWSFYSAILVTDSLPHCTYLQTIEIPDHAQVTDELYTFYRTSLAKEPIYKSTLEIYASFPIVICVIFVTAVANYLPNNLLFGKCFVVCYS